MSISYQHNKNLTIENTRKLMLVILMIRMIRIRIAAVFTSGGFSV